MHLCSEQFPYLFYRGQATTFKPSQSNKPTYFGGPSKIEVTGAKHGPAVLHHIATISTSDLGIKDSVFGYSIPFYYGMRFECCELNYKLPKYSLAVASAPTIVITDIDPTLSSKEWPYAGYPELLPYLPLEIRETADMPLAEFSETVMQGIDRLSDDELVLVVPPNSSIGVSLWGPWGDAADVQIIFIYNTKKGTMRAGNACT